MKDATIIMTANTVLVCAFYLVTLSGTSEALAKGPGSKSGIASRVKTPAVKTETSSSSGVRAMQAKRKRAAPVSDMSITKSVDKGSSDLQK